MAVAKDGASLSRRLGRIVEDITTLEVNTIICDGMTGEQMTDPRHALFDLGSEYLDALMRLDPGFEPPPEMVAPAPICGGRAAFRALHKGAREALRRGDDRVHGDRAILTRVKVKSGQLVALFDRLRQRAREEGDAAAPAIRDNELTRNQINGSGDSTRKPPPLPLAADDRVLLRKTWELSTELIALQSVITLDGDVVSRVSRDFADDDHKVIHRIHGEGLTIAMANWSALMQAIAAMIGSVLGKKRG
ncbi:MAG: hypothetical protein R3A79_16575 [Nannocystaceae bacterium]